MYNKLEISALCDEDKIMWWVSKQQEANAQWKIAFRKFSRVASIKINKLDGSFLFVINVKWIYYK